GVNGSLSVVTGRKRGAEISLSSNDLRICAQPLLVRFENSVECALRCIQQFFSCVLLFECCAISSVLLPHISCSRVTRSSKFVLRLLQVRLGHIEFMPAREPI